MRNLKMFCICIHNQLLDKVKSLDYIPVGLGDDKFDTEWIKDNIGDNISEKNKFYGEYTFHYWFWKNELKKIEDNNWIGFCAYRRFWSNNKNEYNQDKKFKDKILKEIPEILVRKRIQKIEFGEMTKKGSLFKKNTFLSQRQRTTRTGSRILCESTLTAII